MECIPEVVTPCLLSYFGWAYTKYNIRKIVKDKIDTTTFMDEYKVASDTSGSKESVTWAFMITSQGEDGKKLQARYTKGKIEL